MTIHIYYRHTNLRRLTPQARPSWFSHGGAMANLLSTIRQGLIDGTIRLNVVFDGTAEEFEGDEIHKELTDFENSGRYADGALKTCFVKGGDQRKAWRACLTILDQLVGTAPDDLIYVLENDYFHVPGWPDKVAELQNSSIRWDYLSLYDHLDKYPTLSDSRDSRRYLKLKSQVFATRSHHWRTTPSTCGSFLMRYSTYRSDRLILGLGLFDFKLFKVLTILRRRTVLSPIPSLSTHSMAEFTAPAVAWDAIAEQNK